MEEGTLKMALSAAAAVEVVAEEVEGLREDEADDWSKVVRRSQRHEGQKPVNCSSGWRSQVKEERCGCAGGGSVVGFITDGGVVQFAL